MTFFTVKFIFKLQYNGYYKYCKKILNFDSFSKQIRVKINIQQTFKIKISKLHVKTSKFCLQNSILVFQNGRSVFYNIQHIQQQQNLKSMSKCVSYVPANSAVTSFIYPFTYFKGDYMFKLVLVPHFGHAMANKSLTMMC